MRELVSVIVLTYNSEKYIKKCLRSLELQYNKYFEAIIVDAGSTDNTKLIVTEFDNRFKWLELPGSDMGMARNFGIENSRGKFISFLDSDDIYLPEKLSVQTQFLEEHPDIDVLFSTALHYRTGNLGIMGAKKTENQPTELKHYFKGLNHNLNTMFMRREIWESGFRFGEKDMGKYGEEWRLQISMAVKKVSMFFLPVPVAIVELRLDSHTLWSRQWIMKQMALDEVILQAGFLNDEEKKSIINAKVLDQIRFKLVIAYLVDGKKNLAQLELKKIKHTNIRLKTWLAITVSKLIPVNVLQKLLIKKWLMIQDSSFNWNKTNTEVYNYLHELNN